jgi:RimJ/RimL family protein N-acetyltransferase
VSDTSSYDEEVELRSGGRVRIRAIRPSDKEGLLELFHALSPRSVYSRFLYRKTDVSPEQLKYFTELDFDSHVGLVATIGQDKDEKIVGVGRYIVGEKDDSPRSAEIAFAVADAHQGHGIGQELLKHLASIGAASGVGCFEATVDQRDGALLKLLEHSGFGVDECTDFGRVQVRLDLRTAGTRQAG